MASQSSAVCCSVSSLKVATIVLGSIGLVLWPTAIGFTCGYGFYALNGFYPTPMGSTMLSILIIGVNIAYIYLTSLIIFKLTESPRITPEVIQCVRKNTARLVAFLLIGFAGWVNSVVWYAMYGISWDGWFVYITHFICSFSFVWTTVVAAVAGSLTHMYVPEYEQTTRYPSQTYDPEGRFQSEVSTTYERRSKEPIYAHPNRNSVAAPVHGQVAPWADHM